MSICDVIFRMKIKKWAFSFLALRSDYFRKLSLPAFTKKCFLIFLRRTYCKYRLVYFHNLESGSNELQSGFSENQPKLVEKTDTQPYLSEPRGVENAPESFACLFDPQWTFGNPLRAMFSKIKIFSGTAKFSSVYAGAPRVPLRVLAVWAKTLRGQ